MLFRSLGYVLHPLWPLKLVDHIWVVSQQTVVYTLKRQWTEPKGELCMRAISLLMPRVGLGSHTVVTSPPGRGRFALRRA